MKRRATKGAALVTGAARRIGFAIATKLAQKGFDVALHASPRSQSEGETRTGLLAGNGVNSCLVVGDLADVDSCREIVREATRVLGPLTLLVNNASIFESDRATDIDLDLWERHFAVNLRAPIVLAQHFAAQAPANSDALIVNLIDQRVLHPTPLFFSYTLSKSALWTATRTMAQAFAERGIRVNAIGPGPVLPNASEGHAGFAKEIENLPLRRAVTPDDVAEAVLYLTHARGVTGQMIAVDAGQHLAWRTPDVID